MSVIRPAMADGRAFTSYQPACVLDSILATKHSVYGPEYRHWLQHNSDVAYNEMRRLDVCYASPCFIAPYPITPRPRMTDPEDPRS